MSWRPLVEVLPSLGGSASTMAELEAMGPAQQALPPLDLSSVMAMGEGGTDPYAGNVEPAPPAPPTEVDGLMRAAFATARGPREAVRAQPADAVGKALQQAKQQGYEEGAALARAENEAIARSYRGAIEELAIAREQAIGACEADLVRLALAIAREVLMADVPGREDFTARMAQHAVQALAGGEPVALRMNPKDVQSLRQHKPELAHRSDVQLIEDPAVELGGVVAEGARGRMDATIEARLAQLRDKLLPGAGGSAVGPT